jgi:hypothetical protein
MILSGVIPGLSRDQTHFIYPLVEANIGFVIPSIAAAASPELAEGGSRGNDFS